jgi:DNA-binding CsgD family transcriptional regulator
MSFQAAIIESLFSLPAWDFPNASGYRRAKRAVPGRESDRIALDQAVEAVPEPNLTASLREVAARLPLAASVESATIRLRAEGSDRLHLLAAVGIPFRDVRRLALEPLTVAQARSIVAVGPTHTRAQALGLVWLHGEWLSTDEQSLGLLLVSSRTARRPDGQELALVGRTAARLAERLNGVDRSPRALRRAALALVRELVLATPPDGHGALAPLRPRERTILELYVDGLSAREIAEMLVISPHTVRTHLKLAFGRLGVHSRDEAATLVRRDQLLTLL